jgi:hypothetical protein
MSQSLDKKRPRLSPTARVVIALAIIGLAVVLSFFLPGGHEDASNVTGDTVPSTAVVTNFVSALTVNRSVDFNHVHFTVTSVTQAAAFSDDLRRGGKYTVRVELQASSENGNQAPVGIDYPALVRLLTLDGQAIAPKLVSIAPLVLPNQSRNGYIDFPVNTQVDLSSLMLRLGSGAMVAFG